MRILTMAIGFCLTGALAVAARVEPGLPVWNDAERATLEKAGWVAGGLLLTDGPVSEDTGTTADEPLDVVQPTAEEIAGTETPANEIPDRFRPEYFDERPKTFLVDPQGLLGPVDYRDRLGFLNYHAGDSSIDLFVYVFKGDQEIPGEVREEEIVERFFSEGRPAAVVYYYMGAPQRSVLYLSPSLTDIVSAADQRRAMESSVMQAFKDVDPSRQIEGFLVQMSIRIYWMERMIGGASEAGDHPPVVYQAARVGEETPTVMVKLRPLLESAGRFALPASLAIATLLVAMVAAFLGKRRARYRFPEFDVEPRLGGSHAAGVGAVISFASSAVSPASQRDQVPDYLRRA